MGNKIKGLPIIAAVSVMIVSSTGCIDRTDKGTAQREKYEQLEESYSGMKKTVDKLLESKAVDAKTAKTLKAYDDSATKYIDAFERRASWPKSHINDI